MPLSPEPSAREAQIANLKREATATTWQPGDAPALTHGLRTRNPAPATIEPIVAEIAEQLGRDLPLQADGGGPLPFDRIAVEAAAVQLLIVRRCSAWLAANGDIDDQGRLRPELEALGRASDRLLKGLAALGMTPRARAALGLDLAKTATAGEQLRAHLEREYGSGGQDGDESA